MKRYASNATQVRWDGKEVYKSTVYPTVTPKTSDLLITANETDYLDTLAQRYYNDPTLWWIIASVNNVGKGRMSIEPGTQLRVPQDILSIINAFKSLNQ